MSSNSASLRRIRADIRELAIDPSDRYHAAPLESDMFEWHFTIKGSTKTDFENGIYHGRILLPPDYPYKPPHIIFLTPTGRFETHTKICLSFSAYHPELWQPAWGIRLILEALIAFLPTPADGAIGAIDWSSSERKKLAIQSHQFYCPTCQCFTRTLIPQVTSGSNSNTTTPSKKDTSSSSTLRFQKEIEELQRLQCIEHPKESDTTNDVDDATNSTTMKVGNERTEKVHDTITDTVHVDTALLENTRSSVAVSIEGKNNGKQLLDGSTISKEKATDISNQPFPESTTISTNSNSVSTEPIVNTQHTATPLPVPNVVPKTDIETKATTMDRLTNVCMVGLAIICAALLHTIHSLLLEIRDLSMVTTSS